YCSFFFQAEDGIRDFHVTGVQTCALPIYSLEEILFLSILHHYRGIQDGETAIDIETLSKHTKMPPAKIIETIESWVLKGFCTFTQAPNDTNVILTEIREDDITINRVAKNLTQFNTIKDQQFKARSEE